MKNMGRIIRMMKGYNVLLIMAVIVSFVTAFVDLLGPYLLSQILEAFESSRESINLIVVYGVLLIFSKVLDSVHGFVVEWYNIKTIECVRNTATQWIFQRRRYGKLPIDEGGVVSRLTGDVDAVTQLLASPLNGLIPEILKGIGACIMLASIRWEIAVLVVCFMPIFFYLTKQVNRMSKVNAQKVRAVKSSMTSYFMDFLKNYRLYVCYNGREQEELRSGKLGYEFTQNSIKQSANMGIYFLIISLLRGMIIWMSLFIVHGYIASGVMSGGVIIMVVNYVQSTFTPVIQFSRYTNQIAQANVAIQRVFELEPKSSDCIGEFCESDVSPIDRFSVQNMAISYGDNGQSVVSNVNFDIQGSGLLCLYGASGSGKSTILNTLCGLLPVREGSIKINGEDYTERMLNMVLQKRVRIVFQNSFLFNRSIIDNVTYGMDPNKEQEAFIVNFAKKLKMDLLLENIDRSASDGVSGDAISGGERKRVALMRGLNQQADIYLFDEPTSELDDESRQCVLRVIEELKQKSIVIVSTHDSAFREIADSIVYV